MLVRRKRRGVNAIIVTLFLIIVSLIASVMLSSFTFGIMGNFLSPAEVSAQGAVCSSAVNSTVCQLTLVNIGGHDTTTAGSCAIGGRTDGSVAGGGTVPAGGALKGVECVVNGSAPAVGANVRGVLALTNGGMVFFVGSVQ